MTDPDSAESVFFPPFDTCLGCRSRGLQAIAAGERVNFFCPACHCCWHVDLGWVHRVDPAACPGCLHISLCLAGPVEVDEPGSDDLGRRREGAGMHVAAGRGGAASGLERTSRRSQTELLEGGTP